jgi:hypothetical protein
VNTQPIDKNGVVMRVINSLARNTNGYHRFDIYRVAQVRTLKKQPVESLKAISFG